jgi:DNA-binding protein H-NS
MKFQLDKTDLYSLIGDVHHSIEKILSQITTSAQTVNLYRRILENLFDKEDHIRRDEIASTKIEIEKNKTRMTNIENQLMDDKITPEDYHTMKQRLSVATSSFTPPTQVLPNIDKVFRKAENKKEVKNDLLGCFAPPTGSRKCGTNL